MHSFEQCTCRCGCWRVEEKSRYVAVGTARRCTGCGSRSRGRASLTAGESVLTSARHYPHNVLYAHQLSGGRSLQCRAVQINERRPGMELGKYKWDSLWTFAYVETTEPLCAR